MIAKVDCDIDIDLADRNQLLDKIVHIPASRNDKGKTKKHNSGIYLHQISTDPITGWASIDYKAAQERGYFKFDLLNVSVYQDIRDEDHLNSLMNKEPLWDLLLQDEFVDLLFHLNGHVDILRKTRPTSVEQLAAVLAMIRPAKRHLIGQDWDKIMKEVWTKPTTNEYFWKKSHAFSYAYVVIVQMNLICETLEKNGV